MRQLLTVMKFCVLLGALILAISPFVVSHQTAYAIGVFGSTPAAGGPTINMTALVGNNATTNIDITDTDVANGVGASLDVSAITFSVNPSTVFSFTLQDAETANPIANTLPGTPISITTIAQGQAPAPQPGLRIVVTCTPATSGSYSTTLQVTHDSGGAATVANYAIQCDSPAPGYQPTNPLNGNAALVANDVIAMAAITDEAVAGNPGTEQQAITITNNGAANSLLSGTLTLQTVGAGGDPEIQLMDGVNPVDTLNFNNINQGGSTTINARCIPNKNPADFETAYTRQVTVTHNAPTGVANSSTPITYTIQCNVLGTPEFASTPAAGAAVIDLGTANFPGTSYNDTAILVNNNQGNANLQITDFTFTGANVTFGVIDPNAVPAPVAADTDFSGKTLNPTPGTPYIVNSGTSVNLRIGCDPADLTTPKTGTLTITYITEPAALDNGSTQQTTTAQYTGLTCAVTTPRATYGSSPYAPGNAIPFSPPSIPVGSTSQVQLTISNTGQIQLGFPSPYFTLTGAHPGDFSVSPSPNLTSIPAGGNSQITIGCTPTAQGARTATLTITHDLDTRNQTTETYNLSCTGTNTGPVYTSNPIAGNPLAAINTTVNTQGVSQLTITNTGNADLTVNGATMTAGSPTFSVNQGGAAFTGATVSAGNSITLTVACLSGTPATNVPGTLRVTHSGASTVDYNVQCTIAAGGGGTPAYNSSPVAPGGTVSISASPSTATTSQLTISNTGGVPFTITSVTLDNALTTPVGNNTGQITVTPSGTVTTGNVVNANGSLANFITLTCQSAADGTFETGLRVVYSGSATPVDYLVRCVVSAANAAATSAAASTSVAATTAASAPPTFTQCQSNLVLSTPFPQNAAGEYLLVNCFTVTGGGTVNIPLSQVLTNPYSSVTQDDQLAIQQNAGVMSIWRMGSWFLTPDGTYNAATQTYTFTSAAGTNIYAFFYGAITEAVGAQSATFAGTTTGNVEGAENTVNVIVDEPESNAARIAALLSTLFILIVGGIALLRYAYGNTSEIA